VEQHPSQARQVLAVVRQDPSEVHCRPTAQIVEPGGRGQAPSGLVGAGQRVAGLSRRRHHAHREIAGVEKQLPPFGNVSPAEIEVALPKPTLAEDTQADYARTGLTFGLHIECERLMLWS